MTEDQQKVLLKIIYRLLCLTPIGYFIASFNLMAWGEKGIYVEMGASTPFRVSLDNQQPTKRERLDWFINGIFLLAEGYFAIVISNSDIDHPAGAFVFPAVIYGLVSITSAVYPRISWNKPLLRR